MIATLRLTVVLPTAGTMTVYATILKMGSCITKRLLGLAPLRIAIFVLAAYTLHHWNICNIAKASVATISLSAGTMMVSEQRAPEPADRMPRY